jgi:hypothetical protein
MEAAERGREIVPIGGVEEPPDSLELLLDD